MRDKHTILVVDDEQAIVRLISAALEQAGYTVAAAPDGEAGLKLFQDRNGGIDLVVSDVLMPRCTGDVMVREMVRRKPELKVIFITGYTDETVTDRINALPFEVIPKPFPMAHLIARVRATLNRTE
jgi:two-component system cell cycle sensor histidine kinase/response regulator CckA